METLAQYTTRFFNNHQEFLTYHYPGLTQRILLKHVESFAQPDESFFEHTSHKLMTFLQGCLSGKPLAYLLGKHFFYQSDFFLEEGVFVPRFETEILVEKSIQKFQNKQGLRIADLCCGSGAIGLSVIRELQQKTELVLVDLNHQALRLAKRNYWAMKYHIHPETEVSFCLSDRLEKVSSQFDAIMTNPPYIPRSLQAHSQVHAFEPHQALYLDDSEYFEWFRTLFAQLFHKLKVGGTFLMEGHEERLEELSQLAQVQGFQTELIQDYGQRWRFLQGLRHG